MTYFIKLTDRDGYTRRGLPGETLWVPGGWQQPLSGEGSLCDSGWYHFYYTMDLAVLLNPVHADIMDPRGWRAECRGKSIDDNGLKIGWTEARIVEEIELPVWTLEQKVAFAIYCVKEVYSDLAWTTWADKWLSGEDRSAAAARAATWAAEAAAWAAEAAAWAAANARHKAKAAARAAEAAKNVAPKPLDFEEIIRKAKAIK